MDGIGGKPGWAWIFILVSIPIMIIHDPHSHDPQEGLFSILMGILGFFLVPSTIQDSRFLTQTDKDLLKFRLEHDRPSVTPNIPSDKFTFREIFRSITSIHVILLFLMLFVSGTTLYGLALFSPSIVNQLGFSPVRSQLLSVGPFAAGFFGMFSLSILCHSSSDCDKQ